MENLTGAYQALFTAEYNYYLTYEKLSKEEAEKKALDKVKRSKELIKKERFKY